LNRLVAESTLHADGVQVRLEATVAWPLMLPKAS